ncbi:MAG: DUF6690 family protein [Planctomycetaceae bacterium]
MLRTPKTLAMLAAAVGIPYTASETEIGRDALRMLGGGAPSVSAPAGDYLGSSPGGEIGSNAHRDVEGIWESTVDRYRYSTPLEVVPPAGRLVSASNRSVDAPAQSESLPGVLQPSASAGGGASLVGQPVNDLREVLRFDISPQWVTERFSRVTTVLAELQLDGLRVPLVTGIGADDLAGSISYYFDQSGRLQRVMLHGFTGDPNAVVATMTEHYGLQSEPTLEAGVYSKRWNGMPVHFLRITRAPIVYSDAVHHKFIVFLELNQPDLRYGISPEAQRIVSADRSTGRW